MKKGNSANGNIKYRESKLIPRLLISIASIAIVAVASFFFVKFINKHESKNISVDALYAAWNRYDYQEVYDISGAILEKNYLQNTARTFRGFSSYFLARAQTDNSLAQKYIDECIENLRIALQNSKVEMLPQVKYILGKAYFYKNTFSNYHYYSDLVIKYLNECYSDGYRADDISEFLGMSYANLGMTRDSITAFTEALRVRESDVLLLSIAEQYCKNGQPTVAKQYFFHVLSISQDDILINRCHNLLGQIYIDEENYNDARAEFEAILSKDENSADAHYGLGVLYEKQGDLAKARSEWRRAIKLQFDHAGALQKLAESR